MMTGPRDWSPTPMDPPPRQGGFRRTRRGSFARGVWLSLLVIPFAVAGWLALWQFGVQSSLVGLGLALGAVWLFRLGSGGVISGRGVWAICIVIASGVLLCLAAALVFDGLVAYSRGALDWTSAWAHLTDGGFWGWFGSSFLAPPSLWPRYGYSLASGLLLAAVGAWPTLWASRHRRPTLRNTATIIWYTCFLGISVGVAVLFGANHLGLPNAVAGIGPDRPEPQVGECFVVPDETRPFSGTTPIPCDQPHSTETFGQFSMADPALASAYPETAWLESRADELCKPAFEAFVGLPPTSSTLGLRELFPTSVDWQAGEPNVRCMIFDPAGPVVGTLAGAAR